MAERSKAANNPNYNPLDRLRNVSPWYQLVKIGEISRCFLAAVFRSVCWREIETDRRGWEIYSAAFPMVSILTPAADGKASGWPREERIRKSVYEQLAGKAAEGLVGREGVARRPGYRTARIITRSVCFVALGTSSRGTGALKTASERVRREGGRIKCERSALERTGTGLTRPLSRRIAGCDLSNGFHGAFRDIRARDDKCISVGGARA